MTLAIFGALAAFTPEQFGAVGDGVADDTLAFNALGTAVTAAHGGKVRFGERKTYKVWPVAPTSGGTLEGNLMYFGGPIDGLEIDFNGSAISVAASTFEIGLQMNIMGFVGGTDGSAANIIRNVRLIGPKLLQPNWTTVVPNQGVNFYYFAYMCEDIIIENMWQEGGVLGFACGSQTGFTQFRTKRVRIENAYMLRVYYPLSFQHSGDQVYISAKCEDCGRLYFPYGCSQHEVWIEDLPHGHIQSTVLIKAYATSGYTAEFNTTSNIELHYRARPVVDVPVQFNIILQFQQSDATSASATIRNISLDVDILRGAGQVAISTCIEIGDKITSDFAADTTTRGYVLDNIVVSGVIDHSGYAEPGVRFMQQGDWSGEYVNNLIVRDFEDIGGGSGSITVNASGVKNVSLENVYTDAPIAITNAAAGAVRMDSVQASGSSITVNGVSLGAGPLSIINNEVITSSKGLGYVAGVGGAITQLSSKSTGVTLDKVAGAITTHNAALGAATSVGFTLTNSTIAATDVVMTSIKSGATVDSYTVSVDAVAAGSCRISLRNVSGGSLSEAVVISFAVIKAVAA